MGKSIFSYILASLLLIFSCVAPTAAHAGPNCRELFSPKNYRNVRVQHPETIKLKISEGREVLVELVPPADPSKPMLLMLPGLFRSLVAPSLGVEPRANLLAKQGFGLAMVTYSTQPIALSQLGAGVRPHFRSETLTTRHLVDETQVVLEALKQRNITNVVPVSFSFSASVSARLEGFPVIIESVPITSINAEKPNLARLKKSAGLLGEAAKRKALDVAYRRFWSNYVETAEPISYLKPTDKQKTEIIEGFRALSQSIENFSWPVPGPSARETRRVFILAEKDNPTLLRHQIETFLKLAEHQKSPMLILVRESGHVLPRDFAPAYTEAVGLALSENYRNFSGVIVITPSAGKTDLLPGEQGFEYLQNLKGSIP